MSDERDEGKPEAGQDASADDARRVILSRRRRFVAVALTSAGVAASSCDKNPMVCLSPVPVKDAGPTGPTVCLSAPEEPPPVDAGVGGGDAGAPDADAGLAEDADAGSSDAGEGGSASEKPPPPPPRVCLRVAPPPKPPPTAPKPCLKFAPPKEKL